MVMAINILTFTYVLINKVDGHWSHWSAWSKCDVTCGHGHMTRMRMCSNPAPQNGGNNCAGNDIGSQTCTLLSCPGNNKTIF